MSGATGNDQLTTAQIQAYVQGSTFEAFKDVIPYLRRALDEGYIPNVAAQDLYDVDEADEMFYQATSRLGW